MNGQPAQPNAKDRTKATTIAVAVTSIYCSTWMASWFTDFELNGCALLRFVQMKPKIMAVS
jgi:hypothetical protein